jgi:hypothetical protein
MNADTSNDREVHRKGQDETRMMIVLYWGKTQSNAESDFEVFTFFQTFALSSKHTVMPYRNRRVWFAPQ